MTERDRPDSGGVDVGRSSLPAVVADLRELRDPRDMRALAHPTRLALLEVLTVHGPLTATQAASLVGESPSSCSFHLRTLARHHFVEEAGGGTGRQRPWRRVGTGTSMPRPYADAEAAVAADALTDLYIERQLARLREWIGVRRAAEDEVWLDASELMESILWVTPAESAAINARVMELLFATKIKERSADPSLRPPGSRPMEALYYSFPVDAAPGPPASPAPLRG